MSRNVVILSAKNGDIVNFLAASKHLAETAGEPVTWIVHKLYEPLLRGVSYVKAHPVTFDLTRVDLAVKLAATMNPEHVIVAQTYGKYWKGRRDKPHNYLAWSENGFGEHFHDLAGWPLVFDKRDPEREAALIKHHVATDRPVILLNVGCAKSSPFPSHHVFAESIKKRWSKRFEIVDFCGVVSPRIYDVLGLMERAVLLITADSAPLHLATAVPGLKVIALVNDKPFLGSETRYVPLRRIRYAEALEQLTFVHGDIAALQC